MVIEARESAGSVGVRTLLERHRLPLDGVDELGDTMIVAKDDSHVVGGVGAVRRWRAAALRSLNSVVQGQRLGHRLTEAAVQMAQARAVPSVFLLTTTADRFFARLGFERIMRDDVPPSVQASVEFRSACPASAVVMRKRLEAPR